jgi:signal peptide peptidase SppA
MNEFAQALTSMVWAMEPRALQRLIAQVAAVTEAQIEHTVRAIREKGDLLDRLHARDGNQAKNTKRRSADVREKDLDIRAGVAHIEIAGPMMKQVPSIFNWLGIKATSTEVVRAELEAAILSDRVESIVLDIDSPGGTVDGTAALAADVYAARGMKPITARVDDMMASAALWVGSQADMVGAGESAAVGSLGVYAVVDDKSRQFENKGIKTHVVSSGELKGAFVDGSHVTEAQIEDLQRNIDTYTSLFVEAVARGRGMSIEETRELATGQMWIGSEAMDRGLVDTVDVVPDAVAPAAVATEPVAESAAARAIRALDNRVTDLAVAAGIHREKVVAEVINAATPAAQSGSDPRMENDMDQKEREELERLRAENAALKTEADDAKAEAEQNRVKLEVEQEQKKQALLNQYADRIPPAARDSVAGLLAGMSPDEAEAYLQDLPQVTRPDQVSTADVPEEIAALVTETPGVGAHGTKQTLEEKSLGKSFGQSTERVRDMVALGEAVERVEYERVEENGKVVMKPLAVLKDGRRVEKSELKRLLGLKGALASIVFFLCSLLGGGEAQATALSAARATQCRMNGITKRYLMEASETIYRGSLVMIDSDGEAVPAAAEASNNNVAGVAQETKTAAASGSTWIRVSDGVICKFAGTTLGQDDVGSAVYAEDDQTVDETVGSNEPIAGVLVEYIGASEAWIYVSSLVNFGRVNVSQPITLTAALTLSEGATIGQAVDTEIEFTENSEDFSFDFAANSIALTTDTGVVAWDFGAIGTTITLANDQTLVSDTDNEIQIGDNSEDISFGFSGSNVVDLSSDTGVVGLDLAAVGTTLTLANDQTIVSDTDNEIQIGDNSEDISFGFSGANIVDLSSDTGVVQIDFAAVGTTLTLANDQTIISDTDNEIQFGDNNEDISLGFGTGNTVEITSDSGVTKVDFTTINLETDGTFQVLGSGATIGWEAGSGANTACATTCSGTGACVIGYDTGGNTFVDCDGATADTCICAGPDS